jgi:CRP/FNR family transcriptional regulator, cyclic AMP receptor protein
MEPDGCGNVTRPHLGAFPDFQPALLLSLSRHRASSIAMKATKKRPFNVKKFLASVDGGRTISTYAKNQTIFSQGDAANSVFYIREGKVKVAVRSDQGKEAVVGILGREIFSARGCLTGQPLRLASIMALTESTIMRLKKAAIVRVLHDEPKFSETFIAHLLA